MATKKFIIEVEEGEIKVNGKCSWDCPFAADDFGIIQCNSIETCFEDIDCSKFNLATMRIKEPLSYEELREFANQYSHNIWEQLMQRFKADDDFFIGANDVSDYVFNAMLDAFKKIMEEEK